MVFVVYTVGVGMVFVGQFVHYFAARGGLLKEEAFHDTGEVRSIESLENDVFVAAGEA